MHSYHNIRDQFLFFSGKIQITLHLSNFLVEINLKYVDYTVICATQVYGTSRNAQAHAVPSDHESWRPPSAPLKAGLYMLMFYIFTRPSCLYMYIFMFCTSNVGLSMPKRFKNPKSSCNRLVSACTYQAGKGFHGTSKKQNIWNSARGKPTPSLWVRESPKLCFRSDLTCLY